MADIRLVEIKEKIFADNDRLAAEIRDGLKQKGVFMLNLMASPGGGKTSLIVQTLRGLKDDFRAAVIEGDIDSMVDAEAVSREGVPAVQIRTGGACHLDAVMVDRAIKEMDPDRLDVVFIENIGNLVCPAEFDTGAARNVMILSVPEGDDKPLKYPLMFTVSDALVVNKIDYLQMTDFDMKALRERVLRLNPGIRIFEVSCKTGEGIPGWIEWLKGEIRAYKT